LRNRSKVIFIITTLAVAGTIVAILGVTYFAERQPYRGIALEDLKKLFRPETKQLGAVIIKTYREFRGNTVRWSAVYFGCLFGSAFLSAMAALLLKLELLADRTKLRNDLTATMATVAALLITLSTTGDFQRKWQANRVAAAKMENLAYELIRPAEVLNLDVILTRIQEINDMRNRVIVGELPEGGSKETQVLLSPTHSGDPEDSPKAAHP